ncbi:hypothetical protein BaRGS_00014374 [Batillaria attramentaria]|uniref:Uncharacterized protein n=1 Tax=Batillaria attramentaria TaxID=370345 RepID=A0ABD0L578_9CAEN
MEPDYDDGNRFTRRCDELLSVSKPRFPSEAWSRAVRKKNWSPYGKQTMKGKRRLHKTRKGRGKEGNMGKGTGGKLYRQTEEKEPKKRKRVSSPKWERDKRPKNKKSQTVPSPKWRGDTEEEPIRRD